jgi:ubiquinone/menaquinone biosynthesis C-methylase UbiE
MSIYEDYQTTSQNYDSTRVTVGMEIVLGCLGSIGKPLGELTLLDAGCGTGNYSQALVGAVGRIEAVDLNTGMLAQAAEKLDAEVQAGRIAFQEASIDSLPFEDQSFDAIVINQVIHHLEDEGEEGYPRHELVFKEFQRVLKPGGMLLINTCSREQLWKGYWYAELIPNTIERLSAKYMEMGDLKALLSKCGFEFRDRMVSLDTVLQGSSYFEPEQLLSAEYRAGDSTFSLFDDKQLEQFVGDVQEMVDKGTLSDYFKEKDLSRQSFGQCVFVCASRK